MPRDEKRRQKSLAHRAAKRKQKKHALSVQAQPTSIRSLMRMVAGWPLSECWLTEDWDTPGELVQIIVARRSPDGGIAAAVILVDLGCLGVKNAFADFFPTRSEYDALRTKLGSNQPLKKAELNLVAKIVDEGIVYANSLGFSRTATTSMLLPS